MSSAATPAAGDVRGPAILLLLGLLGTACGTAAGPEPGGAAGSEAAVEDPAGPGGTAQPIEEEPVDPELAGLLAAADAVDGAVDEVVGNCMMCGLLMAGEPEIPSRYAGYAFHHCGTGCREAFDADPEKWLRWVDLERAAEWAANEPVTTER